LFFEWFSRLLLFSCSTASERRLLAEKLEKNLDDYCLGHVNGILQPLAEGDYLRELARCWERFKMYMDVVKQIFSHLVCSFLLKICPNDSPLFLFFQELYEYQKRPVPTSVTDVGYAKFREHVLKDSKGDTQRLTLQLIDRDRRGESVDRTMLKSVVDVLCFCFDFLFFPFSFFVGWCYLVCQLYVLLSTTPELEFYGALEIDFLKHASTYYNNYGTDLLKTSTVPEYLIKVCFHLLFSCCECDT
jgi:hypothetical protein